MNDSDQDHQENKTSEQLLQLPQTIHVIGDQGKDQKDEYHINREIPVEPFFPVDGIESRIGHGKIGAEMLPITYHARKGEHGGRFYLEHTKDQQFVVVLFPTSFPEPGPQAQMHHYCPYHRISNTDQTGKDRIQHHDHPPGDHPVTVEQPKDPFGEPGEKPEYPFVIGFELEDGPDEPAHIPDHETRQVYVVSEIEFVTHQDLFVTRPTKHFHRIEVHTQEGINDDHEGIDPKKDQQALSRLL